MVCVPYPERGFIHMVLEVECAIVNV
jgi:hypothetical protein